MGPTGAGRTSWFAAPVLWMEAVDARILALMSRYSADERMSRVQGANERPELDGLVRRARTELRDWTDRTDSDPGVALLELFALVGDLLASHTERLGGEGYLGSARRGRSVGHRSGIELEVDGESWLQATDLADSAAETSTMSSADATMVAASLSSETACMVSDRHPAARSACATSPPERTHRWSSNRAAWCLTAMRARSHLAPGAVSTGQPCSTTRTHSGGSACSFGFPK